MGCGSSKPDPDSRPPIPLQQISSPQGGLQMVPTPQRDATGRPIVHAGVDMDSQTLNQALRFMAEYIHQQGRNLRIIAVGGAISTMYLRTRQSTHDLDFFGGTNDFQLLRNAAKSARQRSIRPIGNDWFNNNTAVFVPRGTLEELEAIAVRQNAVVFQAPGLQILAAPWQYAAATKMERCTKPTRRPYDVTDAAAYLHEYIRAHGGRPVPMRTVRGWCQRYHTETTDAALREIDRVYVQYHGRHGIDFT